MMLQNTGAVLSIAFVLAIVTSAVPKDVLFTIFSGVASGLSRRAARAVHPQHAHRAVGAGRDLAGRRRPCRCMRPRRASSAEAVTADRRAPCASARSPSASGTTPRTIRYYEEIGLLPSEGGRESGRHRLYGERDVERLRDALRLKELLGVTLDELKELLEAEEARAALRERVAAARARRRRAGARCSTESLGHIDRQLALVRRRRDEIAALEGELAAKRSLATRRLRELGDE